MTDLTLIAEIDTLVQAGKYEDAKLVCRNRLSSNPDDHDALYLLGTVHLIALEFKAGLKPLSHLLEMNPHHQNALINLGNCDLNLGRLDQAASNFQKVLVLDANNGLALNNLGAIFSGRNEHHAAIGYYQRALEVFQDDSEILSNLIVSHHAAGNRKESLRLALHVIEMDDAGEALFPAFNMAKQYCCWEEADKILPKLIQKIKNGGVSHRCFEHINLALLSCEGLSHEGLFEILKKSGETIDSLRECAPFQKKVFRPLKRWRVAYLSPDFRNHVVNTFIRGLIKYHDREQFEVICYANVKTEDEVTAEYRKAADVFENVSGLTDRQVAEKIYNDDIDFLIDLTGFAENGRLSVLSYRPAPVQMMYLGYPYTSGLQSVDYFITDSFLDGSKNADFFTERQLRLPESFVSFGQLKNQDMASEIPSIRNNFITFGTLINPYKLNREVIRVWTEILKRLQESQLVLNHPNYSLEAARSNILLVFKKQGLGSDRVKFQWEKHPEGNFLQYYNEIDIVLDAFPATGGTTTIDAIWMGKPVITLVGEVSHERLSYSILNNVGINLDDLIAFNQADYVEKTVSLAKNRERIISLHHCIPASLKSSILCDPVRFTGQMEATYIEAWNRKFGESPEEKEAIVSDVSVQILNQFKDTHLSTVENKHG